MSTNSIPTQAAGIKQLIERIEDENREKSTQEIKLDDSNIVQFPGFPYTFESLGEKVLVSIDVFKSGYECKKCLGKKKVESKCECETGGHPGIKYGDGDVRFLRESMGDTIAEARRNMVCPLCNGDYVSMRSTTVCPECKGLGALLHIPDSSKNLPTTGVVVSMGKKCDPTDLGYKVGDRILFGPYAGSMIPTKAGLMFKIIDSTQAWCRIGGADLLSAFDFIIQDKEAM
jgi:co-chaperonin GroES (HSP10)